MPELADYSSKFDPEFSHVKFSKETLLKLLKAYSEYIRRIDARTLNPLPSKQGVESSSLSRDATKLLLVVEAGTPLYSFLSSFCPIMTRVRQNRLLFNDIP